MAMLGPPEVSVDGVPVIGLRSPKVLALMAYLAVEAHHPHSRAALADLLWPDQTEVNALRNLRKTLSRLRIAIGDDRADPPHLLADSLVIQLNRASHCHLDVECFTSCLDATRHHAHRRLEACLPCTSLLERACGCYRGDFLAALRVEGCSAAFDEWLMLNRERLRLRACSALHALASASLARGEHAEARRYAQRLVHLDPLSEAAERLMLRALALSDGRNAALCHYKGFQQSLADELGVAPEDATQALVQQVRAGTLSDSLSSAASEHLPLPGTPLVGRVAELQRIAEYLAGRDQRLVTLHGLGGSGKTRLALESATKQAHLWRDGVWFVPLATVTTPDELLDRLAETLAHAPEHVPLQPEHLMEDLRSRELLLILDGFEHLMDARSILRKILRSAEGVRILVTSRSRLGLRQEWSIEVQGLSVPEDLARLQYSAHDGDGAHDADAEPASGPGAPSQLLLGTASAAEYDAVRLFVQNARQSDPDFLLTDDNLPHVVRICRLVSGLPLGIELAAAWVRLYRCHRIADEIERSPDFLHRSGSGAPEHQQSLRAAFEYAYNLLTRSERSVFRQLSVFHGGFTPRAALQVADAGPADLASLADKSVLKASRSGRLDTHRAVRVYAAEKLSERPDEEQMARDRHARFFLKYMQLKEDSLAAERASEAVADISVEAANVRAAWEWAIDQAWVSEVGATIASLARFCMLGGRYRQAETAFKTGAERFQEMDRKDGETQSVALRLTAQHAEFALRRGHHELLALAAESILDLARDSADVLGEASGYFYLGAASWHRGDLDDARDQLQRAYALAEETSSAERGSARAARKTMVRCLNLLAGICWSRSDHAGAQTFLEQMLSTVSALGGTLDKAAALGNLGIIAMEQGRFADAISRYEQSLRIQQEAGERDSAAYTNLGELYLEIGEYGRSETYLRQALQNKREIGARQGEALVLGYLGLLYHRLGEDAKSLEHSQQALGIALEVGDPIAQAGMLMRSGDALRGVGRLGEAAAAYEKSLALRRELDQASLATECLAGLTEISLGQGDLAGAQSYVEEILSHLKADTLDGTLSPCAVYLTCYRALKANGDPRGQDILDAACDLLERRSAMITDDDMRRSFLENVAAHREIVAECSTCGAGTMSAAR